MGDKRIFKYQTKSNNNQQAQHYQQPKPQKPKEKVRHDNNAPIAVNIGHSNEFTARDGIYSLYSKIDKADGRLIKGLKKVQVFNASLKVSAKGGRVKQLEAHYHTRDGLKRIKKISPTMNFATFDVPYSDVRDNVIKVTVVAKFKLSLVRSKELKLSVFLHI